MANIGEVLSSPEAGWKRYDDTDENIEYVNMGITGQSKAYNGNYHYNDLVNNNAIIKFNFTGDKLRIFGVLFDKCGTNNIEITLDNEIVNLFGQYGTLAYQVLNYEINNLEYKEHFVQIKQLDTNQMYLDAIDIDENGKLKPYNEKIYRLLLKQGSQYYTLKDNSLVLLDSQVLDEANFENNGFDDLNLLTNISNTYKITKQLQSNMCEFDIDENIEKVEVV